MKYRLIVELKDGTKVDEVVDDYSAVNGSIGYRIGDNATIIRKKDIDRWKVTLNE